MFTKPMFFFVSFLLMASFSLGVESVKLGGSNIINVDHSLAKFAARNGLTKDSGCFSEFSENQANTVRKMGEEWQVCADIESKSNANMNENLRKKAEDIAYQNNDMCVKIDDNCRNKFATDGDIEAALECYIELPIPARAQILEMAENCKLTILNVENESRTIMSTKKNCTTEANFQYLKHSDILFENVVTTCEIFSSDDSTTLATTKTPMRPTPPIFTEVEESSTTQSWATEEPPRFPWN